VFEARAECAVSERRTGIWWTPSRHLRLGSREYDLDDADL